MQLPPNFIQTNVNVFQGDILIADTYMPEIAPGLVEQLAQGKATYSFAPELNDIDKLGFKLCTVLRIGKVSSITTFTKDGSPHSLQIPLIVQEAVEDMGFDKSKVQYHVWEKGSVYMVTDKAVRRSRHLSEIEASLKG